MGTFKPIDPAKEDFRNYLSRNGIMDALTKVLIRCHNDRPENALEYIVTIMAQNHAPTKVDLIAANLEIERLTKELNALKLANATKEKSSPAPDTSAVKHENEIDNANGTSGATGEAPPAEEEAAVVVQQEKSDAAEVVANGDNKSNVSAAEPTNGVPETDVAEKNETTEAKEPANASENK